MKKSTSACEIFRMSENEIQERFKKVVKTRASETILLCENDAENMVDFDESSIQSLRLPLEESFLSEIKDFNTSTSMIVNQTDLDISSSFLQMQKPFENLLAGFPKYLPFRKNDDEIFLSYKNKVFDVRLSDNQRLLLFAKTPA
jgi:hypothetical protein